MSDNIEALQERLFALETEAKLAKFAAEQQADLEAQARSARLQLDNATARSNPSPFAIPAVTEPTYPDVRAAIEFVRAPNPDGTKPTWETMTQREEALAEGWDPRRAFPAPKAPLVRRSPLAQALFDRFGREMDDYL